MAKKNGMTAFLDQPAALDCGEWHAGEDGVWRERGQGPREVACPHPITIARRIRNADTGTVRVQLLFRRGGERWTCLPVALGVITSSRNILALADLGVSVASGRRAQYLVEYLTTLLDRNYERIPEVRGVARLGWSETGFVPFSGALVFDGEPSYRAVFEAVAEPKGEMGVWLAEALEARSGPPAARLTLAASFASVLIEPLGLLPFFVHLWSMESGVGKSVVQMLAASVWGDPAIGGAFFPTFRSTNTAMECLAGFLHSLPLFLDELQLAGRERGRFNVYELAAGAGKARATKELGLAHTPEWRNCFITSGETPMVDGHEGAGAFNRVLELDCGAEPLLRDGRRTAAVVRANYGHAGRLFVRKLREEPERAPALYEELYSQCLTHDTTEKQAMAAAVLLTADRLATDWLFHDGREIRVTELADFLRPRESVSLTERGYDFLCGWVSQNANRLRGSSDNTDTYGLLGFGEDEGWVYILRTVFNRVCESAGFSPRALLSGLKAQGLLRTRRDRKSFTCGRRINGVLTECVVLKLEETE